MREYKDFRNIPEEEEVLVCGFDSHQIMESKMKELLTGKGLSEREGMFY